MATIIMTIMDTRQLTGLPRPLPLMPDVPCFATTSGTLR
jgi:hypothetical protein